MRIQIDNETVEAAALGGSLLGGGGGGNFEEGLQIGTLAVAVGEPTLVSVDELPPEATLITVSLVGAPATERYVKPMDFVKAVDLLRRNGVKVDGLITSENGGTSTVNGWFQAAVLGIPVVDAPCNGRAHPTGMMGSMGLHQLPQYLSVQSAVGGNPQTGKHLELFVKGHLAEAAQFIRQASVSAGGLIPVARNPISASYAKEHAAVGAIAQAIEVGNAMRSARAKEPEAVIERAAKVLHGQVVATGRVVSVVLETKGGFDVGKVQIQSDDQEEVELTFWNEYMTLEAKATRIGTFPDLLATVSLEQGLPLASAQIKKGMRISVLHVSRKELKLGAGMRDPALFKPAEEAVGKKIIEYIF